MRLLVIRHADPDYSNDCLTDEGRMEAKALATRMASVGIDEIYTSPMGRAMETAEATASLTGAHTTVCEWAMEMEWDNLVNGYKMPFDIPGSKLLGSNDIPGMQNWKDGTEFDFAEVGELLEPRLESFDAFMENLGYTREGLHYRCTCANHRTIALFCHAGIGNALVARMLDIPLTVQWSSFWMAPSSVTDIVLPCTEGELVHPRCIAYGDTSHLYASNLKIRPRGLKEKDCL